MSSHSKIEDVQMTFLHQEIICNHCDKKVYQEEPVALVTFEKGNGNFRYTDIRCVDCLQEEMNFILDRIENWAQREKMKFINYNKIFNDYRNSETKKKLDIVRNLENNKRE